MYIVYCPPADTKVILDNLPHTHETGTQALGDAHTRAAPASPLFQARL